MFLVVHSSARLFVCNCRDVQAKEAYLQGQIGNPDGEEKPNKKFYDPRVWIRKVGVCRHGRCRVAVLVVVVVATVLVVLLSAFFLAWDDC